MLSYPFSSLCFYFLNFPSKTSFSSVLSNDPLSACSLLTLRFWCVWSSSLMLFFFSRCSLEPSLSFLSTTVGCRLHHFGSDAASLFCWELQTFLLLSHILYDILRHAPSYPLSSRLSPFSLSGAVFEMGFYHSLFKVAWGHFTLKVSAHWSFASLAVWHPEPSVPPSCPPLASLWVTGLEWVFIFYLTRGAGQFELPVLPFVKHHFFLLCCFTRHF